MFLKISQKMDLKYLLIFSDEKMDDDKADIIQTKHKRELHIRSFECDNRTHNAIAK
jgi:hypothetical protein